VVDSKGLEGGLEARLICTPAFADHALFSRRGDGVGASPFHFSKLLFGTAIALHST
jgi:hypothetical protein